jgi:acyl dehydratase
MSAIKVGKWYSRRRLLIFICAEEWPAMTTGGKTPMDLNAAVGQSLGESDWLEIDQQRINTFADATGDHQWIHVDPERAKNGPFGKCIAHGYLSLSLVNLFLPQIIDVQGISMGVNYGCEKVRFPAPLPVGSRVRGSGQLLEVEEVKGGIQSTVRVTVEIEGSDRPACVVNTISRYFPE